MYHFYIDGSLKLEKFHIRVGFALTDEGGTLIWQGGQDILMGTNFEDCALMMALQMVEKYKIFPVTIYTDALNNARYLEKRKNNQDVKIRELIEVAYNILARHSDRVTVRYLPRKYNFLADNQAQKKHEHAAHTVSYMESCIQKWEEGKKQRIHFFAKNDVYLKQKTAFNRDIKSAWQAYRSQKKVVHEHMLVLNYNETHPVMPEVIVFNRKTQEKSVVPVARRKNVYNRNTALSYVLEQTFDYLLAHGIDSISIEMSHSSLSRIFQTHEVVGEMRYSRYVRIFKELARMKEVNFVYGPLAEKAALGIFVEPRKEFASKNHMTVHKEVLNPYRKTNFSRYASTFAYDIVWPHPEQFNWTVFNSKIKELLSEKFHTSTRNTVQVMPEEVRGIAQSVKALSDHN